MKTVKSVITVSIVALLLGLALHATRQVTKANATLADFDQRDDTIRTRLADLNSRLRAAQEQLTKLEQENNAASEAGASAGSAAAAKANAPSLRFSPETMISNHPGRMAEYSARYREALDFSLGGMFRTLRLSPEQIEKFKDLKVRQEQRRMDLIAAMENQGIDRQSAAFFKLDTQRFEENRREEAELLGGGELAQRYLDYSSMGLLRETTRRLGSCEMYPEAPVTAEQIERATEILGSSAQRRDAQNPSKFTWQAYGWSTADWTSITWETATPQLLRVLSPTQLELLRLFLRENEASAVVFRRTSELMAEAKRISQQPGN